jgi:hypothetical protein
MASVQGLYGRLGDLGAIDKHFDAAVSNAASGLDSIVVDTVTNGQRCLEFLRRHSLGVATLVILEKQAHFASDMAAKVDVPPGCHRLIDLIKCDNKQLRTALYWSVRETLVCKDMAHAREVAYKSADGRVRRAVTLQVRRRFWRTLRPCCSLRRFPAATTNPPVLRLPVPSSLQFCSWHPQLLGTHSCWLVLAHLRRSSLPWYTLNAAPCVCRGK